MEDKKLAPNPSGLCMIYRQERLWHRPLDLVSLCSL